MNISLEYFLTLAEERSITRAAEKLFVSQQCVSSHIKKLEQLYQAELFTRRPVFRLTPEGEALRQNLLRGSLNLSFRQLLERRLILFQHMCGGYVYALVIRKFSCRRAVLHGARNARKMPLRLSGRVDGVDDVGVDHHSYHLKAIIHELQVEAAYFSARCSSSWLIISTSPSGSIQSISQ